MARTKRGQQRVQPRPTWSKWLDSYSQVSAWMSQHGDVEQLLDLNGGLVKVSNFLPPHVADGILSTLQQLPERVWNDTSAQQDYAHNNIEHSFMSVKLMPQVEPAFRAFTLLLPDSLHTFSAAKYSSRDHIAPHDDRAYTQVLMEDGTLQTCSRDIAVIYYLTQDWQQEEGGHLVDLEAAGGPKTYVPEYNSAVMFRIPRWHQVTPVTSSRPRYSIFGWFLQPGEMYPLNTGEQPPHSGRLAAAGHRRPTGRQQQVAEVPGGSKQQLQQQSVRSTSAKQQQQQQLLGARTAKLAKQVGKGHAKRKGSKAFAKARQQHQQQLRQLHALVHAPLLKRVRHRVLGADPCMLLVSAGGVAAGSG